MNRRKERVNTVKHVYSEHADNELMLSMNWLSFPVNLFSVVNLPVPGTSLKACFTVDFIVLQFFLPVISVSYGGSTSTIKHQIFVEFLKNGLFSFKL